MEHRQFKVSRIAIYMVVAAILLVVAGELSSSLIKHEWPTPLSQLIAGLIFAIGAIVTLKVIHSKHPSILREIKLVGYSNKRDLIIALILPFVMTIIAFVIALSTGLIHNIRVSTDIHIWLMFLFNCLFAVLYEAFPEEVFMRGLILSELRKRFSLIATLFIQPLLFTIFGGIVHIIANLIELGRPELPVVLGAMVQFYLFGIVLQLYREFAGSLWANMLFHLVCLETTRFMFASSGQSIITFKETLPGYMTLLGLFFALYLGSAIILAILIWLRNRKTLT